MTIQQIATSPFRLLAMTFYTLWMCNTKMDVQNTMDVQHTMDMQDNNGDNGTHTSFRETFLNVILRRDEVPT